MRSISERMTRTQRGFLIAILAIAPLLIWFQIACSGSRIYCIGFGIETFVVITSHNIRPMGRETKITREELDQLKRLVANSTLKPGKFENVDIRLMATNNGLIQLLMNLDGCFKMGDKSGCLSEKDKNRFRALLDAISRNHYP